ncbi:ATP-dependent DNA helicase RecG [Variibacter gotjawalensis]|uniref:ATP-dependent DNA helicase RecG n=1 Tax=Variibacter gotjawalensis TaxID=1333996 RepID=A0A0S3PXJ6_9BRAD|nr:ATP-dependent DNA helicase RecG [Variibacter gotjawalensis]NIK46474.1 ATP-dependent DNA helicase RecG [Variibacter gotjawalensis]RZS48383.1 ATP-dependent DNA helicase RecG [Variibacter gotjawalensis]BAT60642.1 ATP-dependent DNA helicase RecG [Variibacter gotjawalensis]
MRPFVLDPLFASLTKISGIGPKIEKLFARLLDREPPRVVDLLLHLPSGLIDRSRKVALRDIVPGEVATISVWVDDHRPPPRNRPRAPYRIQAHDATGDIIFTYFNMPGDFLNRQFPVGELRHVSGTVQLYDGMRQMTHPDHVVADAEKMPLIETIYPLTEGISSRVIAKAVDGALERLKPLPEWQDAALLAQRGWRDFAASLRTLHKPDAQSDVAPEGPAWSRLAYDELLASQLALSIVRQHVRKPAGRSQAGDGRLRAKVIAALPYRLTGAQAQAMEEIAHDLGEPQRMLRLLQGDVGSGKTVVALLSAAAVIETGRQAALMAPTEILARQHLATIAPLAEKAGIRTRLLTGREKGKERDALLAALADGDIDVLIGTHAVFQDDVSFHNLGLAIVDEQHRFGVHQRLALARKGDAVDMLVLTATPIPRTLVLTYFGDMDVSQLRDKPPGRQPIKTVLIDLDRLDEVANAAGRAIADGQRVYWVCPLVSESEDSDLAAAEDRFVHLKQTFGDKVGLVHGQMKGRDKDAAMAKFAAGETQILVATTVIEVGVDVPAATVMVIEHAERFGLAQLHQLRGRVGRGSGASTCLLLYKGPLGETAKARLETMRRTEDGFEIAEMDLKLRGEGDVLGTRQSGMPGFHVARLEVHGELLQAARDDAMLALSRDPALKSERGEALRALLYLFGRDDAIRLIRAG